MNWWSVQEPENDAKVVFARLYYQGQHHEELERDYVDNYFFRDERVPRIRRLPDSRLVHVTSLYSEQELKRSPTYNEVLLPVQCPEQLERAF